MFNIAMLIKPLDEAMCFVELADFYDMIDGVEVIPFTVKGEYSAAMGFIDYCSAERIDHNYTEGSDLYEFIRNILDRPDFETDDGEYVLPMDRIDLEIYLGHPEYEGEEE